MSVERTRQGTFHVRLMVRGKRRAIGTFRTEQEALRVETAAKAALRTDPGVTLGEVTEKALDRREIRREIARPEDQRGIWDTHLKADPIMAIAVKAVRRRDVLALVDRLKDKGMAHQTMLNVLGVARVGLRAALDQELITVNPSLKLGLKAPKETRDEWHYAEPALQARLLAVTLPKFRTMVAFAMATGIRAGELVSLRLADVHEALAEPFITVRFGGPPDLPTKTGRIRRVPLFPAAVAAVKAQRAFLALPLGPKKKPRRRDNRHGLLFPTEREDAFRDPDHVLPWATWRRIRDLAGAPEFRWHDLRHTCASSLVSGWWGRRWSLEETCAMLGHSDVKVTQRYAKLAESALMKAASETRGAPVAIADGVPTHDRSPLRQVPEIVRSRLGDLNPRPAVYETAGTINLLGTFRTSRALGGQTLAAVARTFQEAVAREDEAQAAGLLEDLAMGVLTGIAEVRLALEALRGGPFAIRRGLELAELLAGGAPVRKGGVA